MKENQKYFTSNISKQLILVCLIFIGIFPKVLSQDYFQQKVNYKIQVTLNDKLHELSAFEEIEYINNSPDTLHFLYFHLWPNAYSNNNTDLAKQIIHSQGKERLFKNPELNGYIDSLDFKVDHIRVQWSLLPNQPDICKIILNKPLFPGKTIQISTPFHVKIPKGVTSRLGHIGESYQISQWYPKPAVYDRDGWHQMPYLDQGELYSEFGSFDVHITLPENYIVGATGDLQNKEEVEKLEILAKDTVWKHIYLKENPDFPASSPDMKTLHFTRSDIHDFAWFADKRFHVMKSQVVLSQSGKEVTTWLMFTNTQAWLWKNAIPYVDESILYFSKWIGDYPYNSFTVVQSALSAGLGMEYPGVAVIGLTKDPYSLDRVIAHEICHNWFYSALGSNERRFPYLDEGMTASYEIRYLTERYPDKKLWELFLPKLKQAKFFHVDDLDVQRQMEFEYLMTARNNTEQALNLASTDYTESNYGQMIYNKAAIGFNYLRAYLGDSLYDITIQDYYRQWKFKHPQPDDLRKVFETRTRKDLSWFFDDFLGTTKRLDYKIVRIKNQQLLVRNVGEMTSPLLIAGMSGDSVCFKEWVDGFNGEKWLSVPVGDYTEFKIDPNYEMPEIFRLNNNIKTSGIFPTADPIQPQLLFSIENPEKRNIMYLPALNWNHENGFMVGAAFHNGFIIPKPFEYLIMPFYSFNNSSLAGYGRVAYNITPYNNFIRKATFSLEGNQFGSQGNQNYQKFQGGIDVFFRPDKETNPIRQKVSGRYILASDLYQIMIPAKAKMNSYSQLTYYLQKTTLVNPYNLSASIEAGAAFQKATVEFNYKLSYNGRGNGLDVRLFAGTMLKSDASHPYYSLAASGRSGREKYLYDGIHPDRFGVFPKSFFSRQMSLSEGGLVSPVNELLGYSKQMISLSFSSSIPGIPNRIGIKPFVNIFLVHDKNYIAI